MKDVLRDLLRRTVLDLVARKIINLPENSLPSVEISKTKEERFGDYATNVALILAGPTRRRPKEIAALIRDNLNPDEAFINKIEIAGPGFLNFFLDPDVWRNTLKRIHREKEWYGHTTAKPSRKILLEFVSANPTGPLHVGHGRGAAVGDTLARLLRACGHEVHTEYYVNDTGNQMRILGRSVLFRYRELQGEAITFPENHYRGNYIREIAAQLSQTEMGRTLLILPEEEAIEIAGDYACKEILQGIQEDLRLFGVTHDSYFREKHLHREGLIHEALAQLRNCGRVEEKDGALWFAMDDKEDEKDRVLVRSSGEPTYFAADVAYHRDKFRRGYEKLIDIWGSDHHGYVPRVRAAVEAMGYDPSTLHILLVQFVTLVKDGKKISMSTRSGEFVTLREVLDEVGADAARFFFLTKRSDSHLDFDLDLAKKCSKDNPVYYVQYAHARVSSIFRIAAERGIDTDLTSPDLSLLMLSEERKLMKHLADFPDMLAEAGATLEPHRITFYLMELAELFHGYYHDNRVLIEEPGMKKARLFLVEAVRQVIANGLAILGVSAPDRM